MEVSSSSDVSTVPFLSTEDNTQVIGFAAPLILKTAIPFVSVAHCFPAKIVLVPNSIGASTVKKPVLVLPHPSEIV